MRCFAALRDENDVVRAEALLGLARRDPVLAIPFALEALSNEQACMAVFEAAELIADPALADALLPWTEPSDNEWLDKLARDALAACEGLVGDLGAVTSATGAICHSICPRVLGFFLRARDPKARLSRDERFRAIHPAAARLGAGVAHPPPGRWHDTVQGPRDTLALTHQGHQLARARQHRYLPAELVLHQQRQAAGAIASTEIITKILLYYFHERAWASVNWGAKREPEAEEGDVLAGIVSGADAT
jgi:hypothetical protein